MCGDFNVNYFNENQNKEALNSLLISYSLYSTIDFTKRIYNNLHSMIDNIFINKFKNEKYSVYSLIKGLSDHDAQVHSLSNISLPDDRNEFYSYRNISKHSLNEFQTSLCYEAWENVFSNNDNDKNTIFNIFLNTFLKKFYPSFLKKQTNKQKNLCRIPKSG